MAMNPQQTRVIDPILSSIAVGYRNSELIGDGVSPSVPVDSSGGQIIEFGKESFAATGLNRAIGSKVRRIDLGYAGRPYALLQDAIEVKVPVETLRDAAAVPSIDLAAKSITGGMDIVMLGLEIARANLLQSPASYGTNNKISLPSSSLWTLDDIDPRAAVDVGREQIRSRIGRSPNTLTISEPIFNALRKNKIVRDQFKYTTAASITIRMLAEFFGVDTVNVGRAVYTDDFSVTQDVWGNSAILSYVPPAPGQMIPAHSYTYIMRGHPLVEIPYYERPCKSWIYPTTYERIPVITCPDAGYLIQNVIG